MRHVAEESLALLADLAQSLTQPFDLPPECLQVGRAPDPDGIRELAVPELAYGLVDGPDRPAEQQCENERETEADRHQRGRLPEKPGARPFGVSLEPDELAVDLSAREHGQLPTDERQWPEGIQRGRHLEAIRRAQPRGDGIRLPAQFGDQALSRGVARQPLERREDGVHAAAVLVEYAEQLGSGQQLVQACAALHGGNLAHESLCITRGRHAVQHQPLARRRQARDVEGGADHACEEWHRHEGESEQDQAAERTGSRRSHELIPKAGSHGPAGCAEAGA